MRNEFLSTFTPPAFIFNADNLHKLSGKSSLVPMAMD